MQTKTSRLARIARFCISGAVSVSVFYGVLYVLTEYLGTWYIASAIISCLLYIGLNFVLQKFWTFQDKRSEVAGRQLRQYLTMAACFFVANTVSLYLLVQYAHLWYIHAQIIVTVILSILSYLISDRIFGKSEPPQR